MLESLKHIHPLHRSLQTNKSVLCTMIHYFAWFIPGASSSSHHDIQISNLVLSALSQRNLFFVSLPILLFTCRILSTVSSSLSPNFCFIPFDPAFRIVVQCPWLAATFQYSLPLYVSEDRLTRASYPPSLFLALFFGGLSSLQNPLAHRSLGHPGYYVGWQV